MVPTSGDEEDGAFDLTLDFVAERLMDVGVESQRSFEEAAALDASGHGIIRSRLLDKNTKKLDLDNEAVEMRAYQAPAVQQALSRGGSSLLVLEEDGVESVYAINPIAALDWYYLEKRNLALLLLEANE